MAVVNSRPAIGISGAVYSVLDESSDVIGGTPSYGTVKNLFPTAKLTVNPNGTVATDWGDDGPSFIATTTGKWQVSLEAQDVDPAAYAEITGQSRANGITIDGSLDTAPYVAFGYKQLLAGHDGSGNAVYRYVWLFKGKFSKSQEGGETKKDTLNYQHMTLAAEFSKLTSSTTNNIRSVIRTDATDVSASIVSAWFNQPVISNSVDLGAFTLTSGAGVISTKTFTLTFAKAGGGTTTVADASAANVAIALASTGTLIPLTSFTPGSASTTPTLAVVTSSTLTGVPYTVFVTGLLHDANGVAVVQKAVTVTPA
jgi:phage major tail protein, phi13 family